MRESLDGPELLGWARRCRSELAACRAEIDALNVFPIADADTGTNLLATMRAAVVTAEQAAVQESIDPHRIAQALARGATTGARGNSGIILSQVLRGIAEAVVDGPLTGERLRVALRRSAVLVRTGLSAPVEGTILTVLDRAAVAAAEAPSDALAAVSRSAADGAARALSETPSQLGVLRAAGVVDAGARGLLVLLDCLVAEVCGEPPERVRYTRGERGDHGPHPHPDGNADSWRQPETGGAGPVAVVASPPSAQDRRPNGVGEDHRAGSGDRGSGAWSETDGGDPRTGAWSETDGGDPRTGAWSETDGGDPRTGAADRRADAVGQARGDDHGDGWQRARVGEQRVASEAMEGRELADDPHFEVMYVISGTDEGAAGGLRDRLAVLGDSVVVVGDGDSTWSAHVHCRDAGAAIEAGLAIGTVSGIRIESFAVTAPHGGDHGPGGGDLVAAPRRFGTGGDTEADANPDPADGFADRGVLAVVGGASAARLFEDAGAVVLRGDHHLDTDSLLRAIRAMPHREVLVLPNGALPAQELVAVGVAARDGSRDVLLLPSASMVQGLAALAVHDRGRIAVDDAFAMSEAAATTRWGALRAARVRALTMVGMCSPGDGLGLVGQDVVVIDPDVVGAGRILLDRMLGLGGELVTLLMGADAGPELAQVLAEHVTAGFPGVEVVVYSGGQQADLVQIGVE
ncbi:DAK2 domain-containing protein [Nocardia lasii]|uniref:DAK2 domain-containing protein n=1 Tax=Nocardia lasii TaxID=1616107 RepID=A0ABW1JTQ4_9NOCA